jgi:8-oxo-dGTP diphosphatase
MVKHRRENGVEYWQLPGGGVTAGERHGETALRELHEETGLSGRLGPRLFSLAYKYGMSTTYLVTVDDEDVVLGCDPEEAGASHQKLVGCAWRPVAKVRTNPEVAEALRALSRIADGSLDTC